MKTTGGFSLDRFSAISRGAVIEAMCLVRPYQLGLMKATAEVKEEDQSFLTKMDTEIGALMRSTLAKHFPGVRCNVEDGGETIGTSRYKIWGDPIDGTLPFTVGAPTSTIIMGVHDTETQKVLSCVIGEPATGRIWFTLEDKPYLGVLDYWAGRVQNVRPFKVWDGAFDKNSCVLLDNPRGFTRGPEKRPILNQEEVGRLMDRMREQRLQIYGSNGLHQALVAQGNDRMAGGITSSIGGPQDVVGVNLILSAGGVARAFTATKDGFEEKSPEAIESYDILVYGNSAETVDCLSDMVTGLRR